MIGILHGHLLHQGMPGFYKRILGHVGPCHNNQGVHRQANVQQSN